MADEHSESTDSIVSVLDEDHSDPLRVATEAGVKNEYSSESVL